MNELEKIPYGKIQKPVFAARPAFTKIVFEPTVQIIWTCFGKSIFCYIWQRFG
jgi:hypothetical protein